MKKKLVSMMLVSAMALSMVACGGSAAEKPADTQAAKPAETTEEVAPAADEGKVLNIHCWNDEFQRRMTAHYPGYEKVDDTHGKIGDVEVVWTITPTQDNAYQDALDNALLNQESAAADDKVDMFLIEADYALKYVASDYTMPVADLGITDADIADQYQYTKDVVTDGNGVLKGLSWQACPGVFFYNRDAAKEVLGTEEPAEVQEFVKDWDTYVATAEKLQAAGYHVQSSVMDSYRVYSNNVTSKWVENGEINIDANIKKWVDDSKKLYDMKATDTFGLWSDDWKKGFYPEGKVFGYFGPAWLVNFCMAADQEGSIANSGRFGAASGPQGFFWGGTWITAAAGTDNPTLIKDIMLKLTTDADIMKDIVTQDDDFVNNKPVMEAMAEDTSYSSKILGGQNPLGMYCAGVATIDLSKLSDYDQACNEAFQNAMTQYFEGKTDYDGAVELFKKTVYEKHPDLKK